MVFLKGRKMSRHRVEFTHGTEVVSAKYGFGTVMNAAANELEKLGYVEPLRHLLKIARLAPGVKVPFKHLSKWQLTFTPKGSVGWWATKRIRVLVLISCDMNHKVSYHNWDVESVEVLSPPFFENYQPITFL